MLDETLEAFLTVECACRRRCRNARSGDTEAAALKAAVTVLRRGVLAGVIQRAPDGPIEAEDLVQAYIASGATWHDLVAAVSRHNLDGATRRAEG